MLGPKLRFGAFIAPFHSIDENPTLAIERDLELAAWMDELGFDEAWIGEHHSAAYEIIASPEVFIATENDFTLQARMAVGDRIRQHAEEKGAENIQPQIAAMMGLTKPKAPE